MAGPLKPKPQIVNPPIQVDPKIIPPKALCQPGQLFEVMATVLPNGGNQEQLRLSVLLSPRLKPTCNTTLANFPLFQDWPQTVANLGFQIMVTGMRTPIAVQPLTLTKMDANLWKAIFPPTIFVRAYQFDQGEHTREDKHFIMSLRERNLFRFKIKQDLYQQVAIQSPTKLPGRSLIIDRLEGAGILEKFPSRIPDRFEYRFRSTLENPIQEFLLNRDLLIQRELQLGPGGLPQGGVVPNLEQFPNAGTLQSRAAGPAGAVSKRRVPILKDTENIRAATGMTLKQLEYAEFRAFTYRPDRPFVPTKLPGVNEWKNIIDFHQIVASLADYPEIMRRLGLVLDFVIPAAGVPPTGTIAVRITGGLPAGSLIAPNTRFDRSQGFSAAPGTIQEIRDGYVQFGKKDRTGLPLYDVVPGDVEGAMSKIDNFTRSLLNPTVPTNNEEHEGFPALRSGGLSVAHAERDRWLDQIMTASQQLNAQLNASSPGPIRGTNIHLTADNLVRGFRIDVRSRRNPNESWSPWRSLCDREGLYYLAANQPPVLQHRDEGWISLGLTEGDSGPGVITRGLEPASGIQDGIQERGLSQIQPKIKIPEQAIRDSALALRTLKPLLVYESLFRWVGWGLSVDRPYGSLPDPSLGPDCAAVPDPERGNVIACSPIPGLNLMTGFVPVPGTLPRLRFGRQYQFRARVVDLAGNSRTLADPMTPQTESQFVTSAQDGYFDRFEPVSPPNLVLTRSFVGAPVPPRQGFPGFPEGEPLSPGESLSNLVIRTANVDPLTDPAMAPRIETTAGPKAGPENPFSDRHIVPPRISVELAEWHGRLDNPQTGKVGGVIGGKDIYDLIVSHDATLSERYGTPGAPEFFVDPTQRPFMTVPYLADPMAAGVTFVIHAPGTDPESGRMIQQGFAGNWPDKMSFRIKLTAGVGNPQFANGEMTIPVPIGEERMMLMSCFLKPGDERLFGPWRWITERATPQQVNQLLPKVLQGRHWMITPFQELKLIHAVQQPVLNPQWVCLQVLPLANLGKAGAPACTDRSLKAEALRHRRFGDTTATLDATMIIHRPSTQSLDLYARWLEPIDQGLMLDDQEDPERRWLYVEGKASPFSVTIAYVPEERGEPVVARGISKALPADADRPGTDSPAPPTGTHIMQDATEMPIEPAGESSESDLPDDSSFAPPESDAGSEIHSRGLQGSIAKAAPKIDNAQIQKQPLTPIPPIVTQPRQPTGPPRFDETPFRCAPAPPPPPPVPQGIPAAPFRFQGLHRFGDTKYRCVNYKSVATSRYRQLFRPLPEETGPHGPRFTRESPWIKAEILNSAPPDSPKVLYIIPTFRWEQTAQGRRRVGGGLRIYLDRPWFSSGDGEQLAVILYPDPRAELPDYAKPYVTQWGLDPLWESGPSVSRIPLDKVPIDPKPNIPRIQPRSVPEDAISPRSPQPGIVQQTPQILKVDPKIAAQLLTQLKVGITHPAPVNFKNAVVVRHDLTIREVQINADGITSRSATQSPPIASMAPLRFLRPMPAVICAFEVKPDASRQLWYCDIDMDPGTAYFPFVRLALARYQVNSITGSHLSPVVLADFVQLVPDRTASIVPDPKNGNQVIVTVAGIQGSAAPVRKSVVEVWLEEANPHVPGELSWTTVPGSKPIPLPRTSSGEWRGTVALPAPEAKPYRIVIKEFEVFDTTGEPDTPRKEERRLVYADALPVKR